jgi:hypothetical protein
MVEHKWRTERLVAAIGRLGLSMSYTTLDLPKAISLIIKELYSKDFIPYGNG